MALLFMDGFDKYGGVNSNGTSVTALLTQGEWTSAASGTFNIVAGLSSTGYALSLGTAALANISKTLPANYGRLIGGIRLSAINLTANSGIQFSDAGTNQCGICLTASTGTFSVKTGSYTSGTVLGTSAASLTTGTIHYLEWDITFATAGSYQLWLDGVSILSGSGNTHGSANNYANQIALTNANASTISITYDDLYLFDNTTTQNNAVLLTSPRIETQFPISDGAVQFAVGASTLGNNVSRAGGSYTPPANNLYLRAFTPTRSCTLSSISVLGGSTSSATINVKPVIYADNAGSPNGGALLSTGSAVTGVTAGTVQTYPLTTPQSLSAGTQYWLGTIADTSPANVFALGDTLVSGRTAPSSFTTPSTTCPTSTAGQTTAALWGNITLASPVNWYEHSNPVQGTSSYVFDATVGHEDLYNFPPLSVAPAAIYAVAVKGNVAKSDAGAKTVSLRTLSGGTDSGGSLTGQAPGTSFTWLTSLFPTDPTTGAAWTSTGLNAAQSGMRVDS